MCARVCDLTQGCSHFPGFILRFNGVMLSVVGDVPVDSEAPVMVHFIGGECVLMYVSVCVYNWVS